MKPERHIRRRRPSRAISLMSRMSASVSAAWRAIAERRAAQRSDPTRDVADLARAAVLERRDVHRAGRAVHAADAVLVHRAARGVVEQAAEAAPAKLRAHVAVAAERREHRRAVE